MPDLDFVVESAEPLPHSVSPHLIFKIGVANKLVEEQIQNVLLQCQIRIETVKRQYSDEEKANLFELYGEPERWGDTLTSLLWTHASATVRPFSESTTIELPVPCTFDFNVAATKYFNGLDEGHIPVCLLFSGTVFYRDESGGLQIAQISWEKEASFHLPVSVWKLMMDHYYPNSAWLNIRRDVFEKLQDYKARNAVSSWEQAFETLLKDRTPALANGRAPGANN